MLLTQLWQSMEARLSAWRRRWWPPDPVSSARTEANRLAAEIVERKAALAEMTTILEELHHDAEATQKQATRLTAQVAECVKAGYESQAWPLALELDELHRRLAGVETEVRRHEQLCWSYEFQLRQLQRKLNDLRGRLRRLGPPRLR